MKAYFNTHCLFLSLLFVFSANNIHCQEIELSRKNPVVSQDGDILDYAFVGGLNSPQFSAVDFNNDGLKDIHVFDRVGSVQMAFQRNPDNSLSFAPELLANFPPIYDWVLLRDYNGDGIEDIFCYNNYIVSGIQVYQGAYDSDNLISFERVEFENDLDIIYFSFPPDSQTQIYVSQIDYPAIDDIDCDGDLDILTFNQGGGYVEYFINTSVEDGNGLDELTYTKSTSCWGGFFESGVTNKLDLADNPGECADTFVPEEDVTPRHSGSSLLTFDEDGDGDKDLLLGDLSFGRLNLARNGVSCTEEAWINDQDQSFPSYDVSVDIPIFPASFYIDINNDGKRDLVAAPCEDQSVSDYECVWYYENEGTDENPVFNFQTNNLFIDEMLDMGTGSRPAYLDYNGDGLLDIVMGNFTFFEFFGDRNTRLYLLENVGTETSPAYELVDEDYLNMNQYSSSTSNLAPTFGDLDGDGDWDALIGEQNGQLFFLENTASAGQPVNFGAPQYGYMGIVIGQVSVPQIIDLNRDGLKDLIIGERGGNINYFQNVGSATNPQFNSDETIAPNQKNLGEVDTRIPGFSTGYSSPWFIDREEGFLLFVGSRFNNIEVYDNIDNNLGGAAFNQVAENIAGFNEGIFTQPFLWDMDGDELYDLVVGNQRGGLSFFGTNIVADPLVNTTPAPEDTTIKLYPNPTASQLTLELPETAQAIRVTNAKGQLIWQTNNADLTTTVNCNNWPAGLYFVSVQLKDRMISKKVVIEN